MIYTFGEYQLDTQLFELRRGGAPYPLEPQVFDILAYLLRHRDRVVTRDELFAQIWDQRIVSDSTLNNRIMAVRKAVGDTGRDQRLIVTLHGRGFRFAAPVEESSHPADAFPTIVASSDVVPELDRATATSTGDIDPYMIPADDGGTGWTAGLAFYGSTGERPMIPVGRETELDRLHTFLDQAIVTGRREVVFVTGETGIGKTTLVDAFLDQVVQTRDLWILHGHCLENRGEGEAYMPVLEAMSRASRSPGGRKLVALLARHAPTWLIQMPWLLGRDELVALQQGIAGATRERMLREMVEALELLTTERPVLLVIEDLHWSDYSTLDLIDRVAHRQEPARLLLLGTFRQVGVMQEGRPLGVLKNELGIHGRCDELALALLDLPDVQAYLAARFPNADFPDDLAHLVHERTDGNPLFMGNILDFWIGKGLLTKAEGRWSLSDAMSELARGVPETLRHLVEQQLMLLSHGDQVILEAAAAAGMEFEAAAVAAAIEESDEDIEERCAMLARHGQFLYAGGITNWIDGTVSTRFRFMHQLYQNVLYDRVPAGRRRLYHRRIGLRLETGYAAEAQNHAHELANHFVLALDALRAVRYLQWSAEQALRRNAHREAVDLLRKAIELLRHVSDETERARLELGIQSALGSAFLNIDGWGSREAEEAFLRARTLSEQLEGHPQLVPVLYELALLYEFRGEFHASQDLMERRLHLSEGRFLPEAHELLACSKFYQGKFDRSLEHARRGLTVYETQASSVLPGYWGHNSGILCHDWAALALWFLGYADQARDEARLAVKMAELPDNIHSLSNVRMKTAILYQCLLDAEKTAEWAAATVALATQQGFHYRAAVGMVLEGWARAMLDGSGDALSRIVKGLQLHHSTGALMDRPYVLGLMADACLRAGRTEDGLDALSEAQSMLRTSRTFFFEPELHRLRGMLLIPRDAAADEIEAHLRRALDAARRQHSRSLHLRAAISLAEFWHRTGRRRDAAHLLEPLYAGFTEGFDTRDLFEAKELLDHVRK